MAQRRFRTQKQASSPGDTAATETIKADGLSTNGHTTSAVVPVALAEPSQTQDPLTKFAGNVAVGAKNTLEGYNILDESYADRELRDKSLLDVGIGTLTGEISPEAGWGEAGRRVTEEPGKIVGEVAVEAGLFFVPASKAVKGGKIATKVLKQKYAKSWIDRRKDKLNKDVDRAKTFNRDEDVLIPPKTSPTKSLAHTKSFWATKKNKEKIKTEKEIQKEADLIAYSDRTHAAQDDVATDIISPKAYFKEESVLTKAGANLKTPPQTVSHEMDETLELWKRFDRQPLPTQWKVVGGKDAWKKTGAEKIHEKYKERLNQIAYYSGKPKWHVENEKRLANELVRYKRWEWREMKSKKFQKYLQDVGIGPKKVKIRGGWEWKDGGSRWNPPKNTKDRSFFFGDKYLRNVGISTGVTGLGVFGFGQKRES